MSLSKLKQKIFTLPFIRDMIIAQARKQVIKKTQGVYPAPLAILDLLQQSLHLSIEKALHLEAQAGKLTVSAEAKQLIHLYFATTELKESFNTDTC